MDPECIRMKDARSYDDSASIQSTRIDFRSTNFEPTSFGFSDCNEKAVEANDLKSAIVWTVSPGARLNVYHQQEIDTQTTKLCDDINTWLSLIELMKQHFGESRSEECIPLKLETMKIRSN